MRGKKVYKPLALHQMLKEIERELREHDRLKAAIMVRRAAAVVAEEIDLGDTMPPERGRSLLM